MGSFTFADLQEIFNRPIGPTYFSTGLLRLEFLLALLGNQKNSRGAFGPEKVVGLFDNCQCNNCTLFSQLKFTKH